MTTNALDYRSLEIINYITDNEGTSKQKVRDEMEKRGVAASITTFSRLRELERLNLIVCRKDRPNSQLYRIFLNKGNSLIMAFAYLHDFEKAYMLLVRKAIRIHTKKKSKESISMLISVVEIYRYLVDLVFAQSIKIWPQQIIDEELLKKMYSTVFSRLADIHLKLSSEFAILPDILQALPKTELWIPELPDLLSVHGERTSEEFGVQEQVDEIKKSLSRIWVSDMIEQPLK